AEIVRAARDGADGARCTALRYLADHHDPDALPLTEDAVATGSAAAAAAAVVAFERMRSPAAVDPARRSAARPPAPARAAGRVPACRGGVQDREPVLAALREAVRGEGPDATTLWTLVDGAGRLGITCAAPVLRHVYR